MKTSNLNGPALDWAVARANQVAGMFQSNIDLTTIHYFAPSTDWAQGGPLIEREKIAIDPDGGANIREPEWAASIAEQPKYFTGPTPLIAAMRAYVASRLGDEVDIPEDLK